MKNKTIKGIIVVAIAVLIYFIVKDYTSILGIIRLILDIIAPIIIGLGIAFVLNIPYGSFERLYSKLFKEKRKKLTKYCALISTYLLAAAITVGIFLLVIPQLISSIEMFSNNIDNYYRRVVEFYNRFVDKYGFGKEIFETLSNKLYDEMQKVPNILINATNSVFDIGIKLVNTVADIIISIAVSIYVLYDKKKFGGQINKLIRALMKDRTYEITVKLASKFNGVFRKFVGGEITEAFIMGALCYVTMSIFKFEYAFIISLFVGATNVIPIFGPIIGAIPGVVILFMVDPIKAFWFIIMSFLLQQFESNIIYPRVVGDSIGLPAYLVFISVIIGGGMFGIIGMILAAPVMSVIYEIVKYIASTYKEGKKLKNQNQV